MMCPVPAGDVRRVLGGCAVVGPVVFTVASLVAGSVQDVYSLRREDISALAAIDAQHAWIMIVGIIALGVSLVALGLGLLGAIDDGRSATVGSILLILAGLSFAAAGGGAQRLQLGVGGVQEAGDVWERVVAPQRPRRRWHRGLPFPGACTARARPRLPGG
jgi:hypothetical protein